MGRAPCCDKANVKKGPWSPEEDTKLKEYIEKFGTGGNWIALPQKAGLKRCGKSCRLRWLNYLRPNLKHGEFTDAEDRIICSLFSTIGSRWSIIAAQLPGRTDNDIKNYWNTKLKKKIMGAVISTTTSANNPNPSLLTHRSKPPNPNDFLSSLTPTTPISSSIFHGGNNCFYDSTSQTRSFMELLDESINPRLSSSYNMNNIHNTSSTSLVHQSNYHCQDQGLMGSTHSNLLMFGTTSGTNDQLSCSSSDGSCNQISYGNKEYENGNNNHIITTSSRSNGITKNGEMMMGNYYYNGGGAVVLGEENQKFIFGNDHAFNGWSHGTTTATQKQNGLIWEDNHELGFGSEQMKQLIVSDSNHSSSGGVFSSDENKTQGKVMYF
ncbi:hypothetical protein MKW94_004423 [Papaver nudicaule]|uniref:Uncharacterized protein n=1 Tax=Papaver nudicaule TaxID=74823 RepID=A0AA41SJ97_PAPNU|nr:hypothetical protein [Papaver nudicaule]